jgi:surfactin synthase thioesterase subunit
MPGREERLKEEPLSTWDQLIEKLAQAIKPWTGLPYAFLGHSLGATLAFEMARYFQNSTCACRHLFVCGRSAPHLPAHEGITYNLPKPDFIQELRRLAGTPEEILADADLLDVFMPALRADFQLSETYSCRREQALNLRISAYGGVDDERVSPQRLEAWREYASASFSRTMFPGGHFFLHEHPGAVVGELCRELQTALTMADMR